MNPLDLLARFEGCDDPVTSLTPNTRDPKQAAQIVHDGLQVRYEQVVYAVRKQLLLVRSDALRATFAVVEEVRDQLGRARHSEEEWNAFLYPRRGEIWPADFSRLAQLSKTRAEWQEALTDCERLGQQLAAGI